MSLFSLSIGDVVAVGTFAWNVYKACKSASADFEEVAREVNSLHTAIKELEDEALNVDSILLRSHEKKQKEVASLLANCRTVLTQLDNLVTKYKSLGTKNKKKWDAIRFGTEGLSELRSKIAFHTSAVNLFLTTLGTGSLGRIEKRLDEIAEEIRAGTRDADSVAHLDEHELNASEAELEWNALKDELVQEGFTRQDLEAHKTEIKKRLRELVNGAVHASTEAIDVTARTYHGPSPTHQGYQGEPQYGGPHLHSIEPPTALGTIQMETNQLLLSLQTTKRDTHHVDGSAVDWSGLDFPAMPTLDRQWIPTTSPLYLQNGLPRLERRASSPINHPGYPRHNPSPSPGLHRSGLNASLAGSVHSDVTTHDGQGRVTKRTITTEWPSPGPDNQLLLARSLSNDFTFQTQDQLDAHVDVHVSNEPHFCTFRGCPRGPGGQGFKQHDERKIHEAVSHRNLAYLCPFCQNSQRHLRWDRLYRHIRFYHLDVDREDPRLRDALAWRLPPKESNTAVEQGRNLARLHKAEEALDQLQDAFETQREFRLRGEKMFDKLGLLGDGPGRMNLPALLIGSFDHGTAFVVRENWARILSLKRAEYDRVEQRVDELVSKLDSMNLLPERQCL